MFCLNSKEHVCKRLFEKNCKDLTPKRLNFFRQNLLNLHFISKKSIFHFFWFPLVSENFLEKNDFYHLNPFSKILITSAGEYGGVNLSPIGEMKENSWKISLTLQLIIHFCTLKKGPKKCPLMIQFSKWEVEFFW